MKFPISERIYELIDAMELTQASFAEEVGIERTSLSHIKDRTEPSMKMLMKIVKRYPEVSLDWLIMGVGSMYRKKTDSHELDLFNQGDVSGCAGESNGDEMPQKTVHEFDLKEKKGGVVDGFGGEMAAHVIEKVVEKVLPPRQVVRVVIYYDDNTYDELVKTDNK